MRSGRFTSRFTRYGVSGVSPGHERLDDPHFESGTGDWTDMSTGSAEVTYDGTNNEVDLTATADGDAMVETAVDTSDDQLLCLEVTLESGTAELHVGTTSGGDDLLSTTLEAGTSTAEVEPQDDTTYVSLVNTTDGTTTIISDASITPIVRLF